MGVGGAQRAAATLANGFAAQGHRVELVETYSAGGECAYHLSPQVQRVQWQAESQRAGSKLMSRLQRLFLAAVPFSRKTSCRDNQFSD